MGIQNGDLGQDTALGGAQTRVSWLAGLTVRVDPTLQADMIADLDATTRAIQVMKDRADTKADVCVQMIGHGTGAGNAIVQGGVDALVAQCESIEAPVAALGGADVVVEGSAHGVRAVPCFNECSALLKPAAPVQTPLVCLLQGSVPRRPVPRSGSLPLISMLRPASGGQGLSASFVAGGIGGRRHRSSTRCRSTG